ncbi:MAG: hypothetical protein ACC652_14830 [Acidimicrobiales bacterium]
MNDETLDELLSAALDGNATEAELARIAETPGAEERLAELQIAADAVSAMLPRVPTNQRESMIAAAVASFEPKGVPGDIAPIAGPQELPTNVVPLRSPLSRQMRSGASMVGGIAASVVVMLFVFNIVGSSFGGSSDESQSAEVPSASDADAAATTAPAEDASALSADAEAFDDDASAGESNSSDAGGSIEMEDGEAATTTEAMSESTVFAADGLRSVSDQGAVCWEQIAQDFAQLSLDPNVDSLVENSLLQIPAIDESGDLTWLVVEPDSCLFIEMLPRP